MQFTVETVSYIQDGRIYCNINTDNNSILIGKNGVILRAFNFIAKNAIQMCIRDSKYCIRSLIDKLNA